MLGSAWHAHSGRRPAALAASRQSHFGQGALGLGELAPGEVEFGTHGGQLATGESQFCSQWPGLGPGLVAFAAGYCLLKGQAMDGLAQLPDLGCLAEHLRFQGGDPACVCGADRCRYHAGAAARSSAFADFSISMHGCTGS